MAKAEKSIDSGDAKNKLEETTEEPQVDDMEEEDIEFMRNVSNGLFLDTVEGLREWREAGTDERHSIFKVNVPEERDSYGAPVILSRRQMVPAGWTYDLTFYETGKASGVYKIDSGSSYSLRELGDLVFSDSETQ